MEPAEIIANAEAYREKMKDEYGDGSKDHIDASLYVIQLKEIYNL